MRRGIFAGTVLAAIAGFGVVYFFQEKSELLKTVSGITGSASSVRKGKSVNRNSLKPKNRIDIIKRMLNERKTLNMNEIHELFPTISQRTLRRDMDKLEKSGVTRQVGLTKDARYIYNL